MVENAPRLPHMQWRYLGLVFVGGALGTLLREVVGLLVAPVSGFPLATASVNIVGAFILGMLLARLTASGADAGRRRALRLFLATGVLGGFTTYSGLATDATTLIVGGAAWMAVGYALVTVIVGAAAAWAGMLVGAPRRSRGRA